MSDKTDKKEAKQDENGYLFSLEVLVKGKTNGHALEKLTHLLNTEEIADYRVIRGINLGQVIEAALLLSKDKEKSPAPAKATVPAAGTSNKKETKTTEAKPSTAKTDHNPLIEQIERYKEERKLVRLSILKGKGVKLSIPCRILNYDLSSGNITVYHVDEKKVYQFQMGEIDDLTAS